ncbi:alpha-amylase family glycosyl hydrolase [Salegentibacter salarius]|uniref:Alpha-amlyase n=1 Tax=Salegentibacter salarius TaxID=435906 RepID=A0A2N0U5K5_9FLAO|nr:alpha-amylase family glycosyl hydrolase [Salegentibacter salarius]OEY74054.1 alpha-amlyase [Salegentibacter salarius]PKD22255.1 alpha-amlyase [Salegentibacter salarius]SLJ86103.1 Alpha amylase, catalytic domain [Salegentibacter salarius]
MKKPLIMLLAFTALFSCKENETQEQPKREEEQAIAPVSNDALESAVIYEANIRQYSPEGTFDAFTEDIPQLKELGVKVIWLMPIYPISMKNRKATGDLSVEDIEDPEERKKYLGSYYAISDYTDVNPEFGNFEDFEELVETAHENGMYVILDWVANHTGWDHKWIEEKPEYYHKNDKGEVTDPINPATGESWGWTDVAHLNFENEELHEAMGEEMKFWVEKYNVDGFRADVAGEVPTEFWESIVPQLKEIKPVFMLAESEDKDLFENAFDMGYNWEGHHIMNEMAQGKKTAKDWDAYMQKIDTTYQDDDYLMNFVTNHDENSWNGTVKERMGDASETMMALTYTLPGMPLIYSGQEYDMDKRLLFFEKDTIPKEKGKVWPLLEKLGELKNENKALHGGKEAASYENIETSEEEKVLAFKREKDGAELIYIANMSDESTNFSIKIEGNFEDYLSGEMIEISEDKNMDLKPWQFFILINK